MRTLSTMLWGLAALGLASGCLSEQRFMAPEGGGPWALAVDEDTPPYLESEDVTLYLVEQRIELELREPSDDELAEMMDVGGAQVPYDTLPFVRRDDYSIQIDWTLSNLSDENTVQAAVVVNGFNEFHEYSPQATIVDDELIVDFSGWEREILVGPGERRSGTIREEQLDEIAVDLATVVNGAPNPNQIVYFENQSANDRRSQMYIPDVVPALTGIRLGLRTDSSSPMVLEATVRVRDERGVLVQGGDEPWELPVPELVAPADLAPADPMTP